MGAPTVLSTPANRPFSTGQVLSGSRLKFSALPNCPGQKSKPTTGVYSYHTTGNRLMITEETGHHDSCDARVTVLTGQSWKKA